MKGNGQRSKAFAIATGLCGLLGATNVTAQAIVVDPAHIVKTAFGHYSKYVQDALQYGTEINQWKQTYDHYRQQLIEGKVYQGEAGQLPTFAKRDPEQGMAESCPTPRTSEPLSSKQHEICQQTVRAQNAQYNEIVKILETAAKRDQELRQIYADRQAVGTDQGKLAANDNQLAAFQARVELDLQYGELVVSTYDSYLARLKDDQVQLAKEALTGKSSVAGDVARGAALSTALKAARRVDR